MEKTLTPKDMITGFLLGKFMPLHKGHLALIDFAHRHCNKLFIIVCYTKKEVIPGTVRINWILEETKKYPSTEVISFEYDEKQLPNTSESSEEVSQLWSAVLQILVPDADVIFTSEPYGEFVARFMNIRHVMFDQQRVTQPVSATQIRNHPLKYWEYLADSAKPYFVKKIALIGSESTGKTTLTERLALYYETHFVPEMARDIIEKTKECTYDDLIKIAELHAVTILHKIPGANKFLFVDTDLTITKSYSGFLFNKKLFVEPWVEEANHFDLYLFLENDCDYIQDGTRLSVEERNRLSDHHKKVFQEAGLSYISIHGDWEQRFQRAKEVIEQTFF